MTPLPPPSIPPDFFGSAPQVGLLTPPAPHQIPSPVSTPGTTPDAVLPVLPDTGTQVPEPVNGVNTGNLASLPHSEAESVTDGIVSKTFKLPTSVMRSLETAVEKLNEVSPGNSTHSYGINLLSRHKELLRSAQEAADYKVRYEQCVSLSSRLSAQLQQAHQEIAHLTAQLDVAAAPQPTPPPAPQPEPVLPADDTWRIRCQELQAELKATNAAHQADTEVAQPLYTLFKALPDVIAELCQEAASNSWNKPEYYQQFFDELITPYLSKQ